MPTRQRPATAANSARLTNPNDRPHDGRPKHSASHIHCAVPFFCARSGTEGERVAVRGRAKTFGGEGVVRSARNASVLRGGAGVLGEGVSLCVGGQRPSAGNASRSQRACIGAAWGSGSVRGGRVAVRGRAKAFGEEWVVWWAGMRRAVGGRASALRGRGESAREGRVAVRESGSARGGRRLRRRMGCEVGGFNAHSPQRLARTHIFNIRPPCSRREIAVLGSKRGARVHTSPASPSAAPAEQSASPSNSYPQWVIHGKVIHIVARRPVQNVLALAPAHAYI